MDNLPSLFTRFRRSDYRASHRMSSGRAQDASSVDGRDAIELHILHDSLGKANRRSTFYVNFEDNEEDISQPGTLVQRAFSFSDANTSAKKNAESLSAIRITPTLSSKRKSNCERRREKRRVAVTLSATSTINGSEKETSPIIINTQKAPLDEEARSSATAIDDRRANRESGFFSSEESAASSLSSSSPIAQLTSVETSAPPPAKPCFQKLSEIQSSRFLSSSLRNMLHFTDTRRGAAASMRRRTSTMSSTASPTSTLLHSGRRASEAAIAYEQKIAFSATSSVPETVYARILRERCRSRSVFVGGNAFCTPTNCVASPFVNDAYDQMTPELHAVGNTQAYLLSLLTPPSTRIVVHDPRRDAATFIYGAADT